MLTRIDHVTICVPDLAHAIRQYARMGFNIAACEPPPGQDAKSAIAFNRVDSIELLAIDDRNEHDAADGGMRHIVLHSDNLAADVEAMRSRGVDVSDPIEESRMISPERMLKWKRAVFGPRNPLPLQFIEHLTPLEERGRQAEGTGGHPNGVFSIERAYIVTRDAAAAAATYARVLGLPQPPMERGMVIMADMTVFQLGPTGLGIAQPYAPGPAADALERRGPGPFQALYRTTGMGAAVRWMHEHGMPPPKRGVRNTGEQAMLVGPEEACGAYIGFVGPE